MKATELRIKNKIQTIGRNGKIHLPTGFTFDVRGVGEGGVTLTKGNKPIHECTDRDYFKVPLRDCCGIELTEEWLMKAGGEVVGGWIHINKGKNPHLRFSGFLSNSMEYKSSDIVIYMEGDFNKKGMPLEKIKYVHQLQNLYFALKEEELIFKT